MIYKLRLVVALGVGALATQVSMHKVCDLGEVRCLSQLEASEVWGANPLAIDETNHCPNGTELSTNDLGCTAKDSEGDNLCTPFFNVFPKQHTETGSKVRDGFKCLYHHSGNRFKECGTAKIAVPCSRPPEPGTGTETEPDQIP